MYRVGTVTRTAQGLLVCRSEGDDAEIGTMVLNDSLETVGRIVDVFGPVEQPYVAITPTTGVHSAGLVGSTLYAR